ncbi:small multidrug resistance protein [bacterium]|nr:small multidrug resistance protein [bacterium]
MTYLVLFVSLIFNALANVAIKSGMRNYTGGINLGFISYVIKNPTVIAGLSLFGFAFIGYSFVLSKLQLSIAYPIMTGAGFLLVSVFSLLLFNESFNLFKILGVIFIFIGIVFLSR